MKGEDERMKSYVNDKVLKSFCPLTFKFISYFYLPDSATSTAGAWDFM